MRFDGCRKNGLFASSGREGFRLRRFEVLNRGTFNNRVRSLDLGGEKKWVSDLRAERRGISQEPKNGGEKGDMERRAMCRLNQ